MSLTAQLRSPTPVSASQIDAGSFSPVSIASRSAGSPTMRRPPSPTVYAIHSGEETRSLIAPQPVSSLPMSVPHSEGKLVAPPHDASPRPASPPLPRPSSVCVMSPQSPRPVSLRPASPRPVSLRPDGDASTPIAATLPAVVASPRPNPPAPADPTLPFVNPTDPSPWVDPSQPSERAAGIDLSSLAAASLLNGVSPLGRRRFRRLDVSAPQDYTTQPRVGTAGREALRRWDLGGERLGAVGSNWEQ